MFTYFGKMETRPSKTEQFLFYNTLVGLVKALEGKFTTIDFRNDSCVTGRIMNVDGYMNVEMEQCTFYNSRGGVFPFESFYVKARNIRYVHIPKSESSIELIKNHLYKLYAPKPRAPLKKTYKQKRAIRYHKETVENLKSSN